MTEENRVPSGDPKRDAKAQASADKAYKKASRPWFKKKRFILPLLLVAIFAIAGIAGGGGGEDTTANNSSAGNTTETEAAPAGEPAEEPAEEPAFAGAQDSDVIGEAGDALKLGDITVTAAALAAGDATLGATQCTAVIVENGSDETIDFNLMDWKMQSPGGTIANATFTGSDDILTGGQIAPGGTTKGDVCFEAEGAEEGQYVVLYEPIFSFFSDRGAWINK